jgi:uncharacterized protein YndB with AHSA1/START domain/dihydrofolate reductase
MSSSRNSSEKSRRTTVVNSGAVEVTLPTDEHIRIVRDFDAPRELIYRAWTTPGLVSRWWSGQRGTVTSAEIDLRVGGGWRYVMVSRDGTEVAFSSRFREIAPSERLVYTEVLESRPGAEALTIVTFTEVEGRTTLEILIRYGNRRDRDAHSAYMSDGLQEALSMLEEVAFVVPVIYSMSVSLDGFIAGRDGDIDWAAPDEELMAFHNEQSSELDAQLSGRRLYEEMLPWETRTNEFARIWQAIPKVVFSTTLANVQGNARLATGSVTDELARLGKTSVAMVSVGGAGLAATLVQQDLIDEYRQFVNPVVLGGGTPFFPERPEPLKLTLVETKTFGCRVVYLRHRRCTVV